MINEWFPINNIKKEIRKMRHDGLELNLLKRKSTFSYDNFVLDAIVKPKLTMLRRLKSHLKYFSKKQF
jgi:hypothetical protein